MARLTRAAVDELLSSPDVPQDAKLIVLILKSMGVTQYDAAVVVQLLEFTHRTSIKQFATRAQLKCTLQATRWKF